MKEELIRIENGWIEKGRHHLELDIEIAKGESIGVLSGDLMNSTLYLDFFRGNRKLLQGKAYLFGKRVSCNEMEEELSKYVLVLEEQGTFSSELTAEDFLFVMRHKQLKRSRRELQKRFRSDEAGEISRILEIDFQWKDSLSSLSPLSFYRALFFKAWFYQYKILILNYLTRALRENDIYRLMQYGEYFLQKGIAFLLVDQEGGFLFSYSNRIDILKNGMTCYRLSPEQYDENTLQRILKGKESIFYRRVSEDIPAGCMPVCPALEFDQVKLSCVKELSFQLQRGEIGILLDRNYQMAQELQNIFLGRKNWVQGKIRIDGRLAGAGCFPGMLGKNIGVQLENPGGSLYNNLSGLENLSIMLIPKTGSRLVKKKIEKNIMDEACTWFSEELLRCKVCEWPPQERLRLSYYRWYLVNPRILVSFFPFSSTDFWMHHIVLDMLSMCVKKGMSILIISTDIEEICGKFDDAELIGKIKYIN